MARTFADRSGEDAHPISRFTYRDFKLLGQSSVSSPLRVITLIDFDCFYAQCESVRLGLSPDKPLGVQQFKHVIAINYAARAAGLKKVVTAEEAKRKCPDIVLQHVPTWREGDSTWRYRDDALEHMDIDKSSLDYYRLQSKKAMALLKETLLGGEHAIERAGIDETYVDLSIAVHQKMVERFPQLVAQQDQDLDMYLPLPVASSLDWSDTAVEEDTSDESTSLIDWDDTALHIGCDLVNSIRSAIQSTLHYTCSAGIARNKVVAKLAAGHNKPNRQTVVRNAGVATFLSGYKFTKIRGLGGKLGRDISKAFNTELVSDLLNITQATLASKIGHSAAGWTYNVIRGNEFSEVTSRTQLKSVLSAKTFMTSLHNIAQAEKWLYIFAADIIGRLEDLGGRRPKTVAVHLQVNGPRAPMRSKQGPIPSGARLDVENLLKLSRDLLLALEREGTTWPLITLSVSVSDLQDVERASRSIDVLLAAQQRQRPRGGALLGDANWGSSMDEESHRGLVAVRPRKRTLFDFNGFTAPSSAEAAVSSGLAKKSRLASGSPGMDRHEENDAQHCDRESNVAQADDEGSYDCPTCNRTVPATDVLEHLDWHAAVELSENG